MYPVIISLLMESINLQEKELYTKTLHNGYKINLLFVLLCICYHICALQVQNEVNCMITVKHRNITALQNEPFR